MPLLECHWTVKVTPGNVGQKAQRLGIFNCCIISACRVERWKPDLGGNAQESVDLAEGYFGEKWTHKHGRLSDDFRLDGAPGARLQSEDLVFEVHQKPEVIQSLLAALATAC